MSRLTFAAILLTAAQGLSPPAVAQSTALAPELRSVHAWPETEGTTSPSLLASCLLPCRLTAGAGPDAVVLRTNLQIGVMSIREAFLLRDIGRAHAVIPIGELADVAILPAGGPGGDAILSLAPNGTLKVHTWPPGATELQSSVVGFWPGFRSLSTAVRGTSIEVFAFDPAGARLRMATWSGGAFGPASTWQGLVGVTGVAAMDWDGDGNLDILLRAATGLVVRSWSMTPLVNIPLPAVSTPLVTVSTCVSRSLAYGDLFVSVASNSSGTVIAWANGVTTGTMSLPNTSVMSIATYDRDADGNEDVLLGDAEHSVVYVLEREPAGFRLATIDLLTNTAAPDRGICAVGGIDLDGDGDGDVLALNEGSLACHTFWDEFAGAWRPTYVACNLAAGKPGRLPLDVLLPPNLQALPAGTVAMRLRVDGWITDLASGYVAQARVVQHEVAVVAGSPWVTTDLPALSGGQPIVGDYHLQLQIGVVLQDGVGVWRRLPTSMLHLVTDPQLEIEVRQRIELEGMGGMGGGLKDGGGDGNILGTKTGRYEIGKPPL